MMKCPWGCGWEGTPEEYSKHLETCPKKSKGEQELTEKEKMIEAKIHAGKYHIEQILEETEDFWYVTIAVWKED